MNRPFSFQMERAGWHIVFLFSFIPVAFFSCSTPAYYEVRESFYSGNYAEASSALRTHYEDSDYKDRLLYLMEAGVSLHTEGKYDKSIQVLEEADRIAETIKTSITGKTASFILSDNEENFKGENFERVMIKFYIALNYMILGDLERARIYFRKLDYEQREMKLDESYYKQNIMARYLDALVSERTERYNDARVQFNNILLLAPGESSVYDDLYVLALKEGDVSNTRRFGRYANGILSFDEQMNRVAYTADMGEIVILHQAGKAAVKESRGKIRSSDPMYGALRTAVYADLATGGRGVSGTAVMAGLSQAENPVPVYRQKDSVGAKIASVELNNMNLGEMHLYQDYSDTAIKNFNDSYPAIVRKNVASLAAKMIAATVSARVAAAATKSGMRAVTKDMGLMGFVADVAIDAGTGYAAGAGAAALVEPDLRCWSLLPSNFQVTRVFVKPGRYKIKIQPTGGLPTESVFVTVTSGEMKTVSLRSFTRLSK